MERSGQPCCARAVAVRRKVPGWFFFLVIGLLLSVIWGFFSSSLLIHVSRLAMAEDPGGYGLKSEKVFFQSEDGISLSGWFIPALHESQVSLILCHGWGANKSDILPSTLFLRRAGFNLFYFDFRNHGESDGNFSSLTAFEIRDLKAALQTLRKSFPKKSRRIGLYGISMGASVALTFTAQTPEICAVCADSPFASYEETVARFGKVFYGVPKYPLIPITLFFTRWRLGLNPEPFSPIEHVSKISPRPMFLICGDRDARMPVSNSQRILAKAGPPKELWVVEGADHMEAHYKSPVEYEKRVAGFFRKHLLP